MRPRAARPLADACPADYPGDVPATEPHVTLPLPGGDLHAEYRCRVCGHRWVRRWGSGPWPAASEDLTKNAA